MQNRSLRQLSPLRVIIGSEDVSRYVSDSGFTFSNVDPGGFEAFSAQFPRDMDDTLRGQYIRIDSGLSIAWEGRVSEVQRSLGHNTTINGEGYGALFKDTSGSMVFVDRDLTAWQPPSYSRQIKLLQSFGWQLSSLSEQVAADASNAPALVFSGSWPWSGLQAAEAWYDAGPENVIAEIYVDVLNQLTTGGVSIDTTGALNVNDFFGLLTAPDQIASSQTISGALACTGGSETFTPSSQYRYAFMQLVNDAAVNGSPASGSTLGISAASVAVYGNHGLTQRGSAPAGFYPSDIFGWVLAQIAGLQAGTVQLTDSGGYIVPHSAYKTPVTLDQIVQDMATVQGWHWGVWPAYANLTGPATPRADFRPRPAPGAYTAFIHRDACSTCDIREDLSQQYDRCVITFTAVDGSNQAAIVTTDNPILDEAGIPTRTLVLSGGTMTPATAALFAAEALALTNAQARVAGSLEIISPVLALAGPSPAWLLQSGIDRIRVGDAPSLDAWGSLSDYPITRVEASISSGGMQTSVELGAGADLVETLQARLSAASSVAAQGGV